MFTWLGAAVGVPHNIYKFLSIIGFKIYFLRLPRTEVTEDDLVAQLTFGKQFSEKKPTETIREWLDKCNNVRRLDNNKSFNDRIHYAIESTLKKQIPPMSPTNLKSENRYQNLYKILRNKGVLT